MARLNHAKLAHHGRATERAFVSGRDRHIMRFAPAKAASTGRSLDPVELARVAASLGMVVKGRAPAANDG